MKAVVIGAGAIAKEHLGAVRALEDVELSGVCDLSPATAEAASQRFGADQWGTDHRALLDDITPDVVHVTTPASTHAAIAIDALERGAHVIVEKPLARDLGELASMRAAAERADRMLIESHNYLFNAPVRRLLDEIEQGVIGDVVHVDVQICLDIAGSGSRFADRNAPHPALDMPGGAIGDFLPHFSYLVNAFAGAHETVHTTWRKRHVESPLRHDEMRALIRGSHADATMLFSSSAEPPRFTVEVVGTRMRALVNLFESTRISERLTSGAKPLMPMVNGLTQSRESFANGVGSLWRKLSGRPVGYEGLWVMIGAMYDAVRSGGAPPVTTRDVEASMRLAADICDQEPTS